MNSYTFTLNSLEKMQRFSQNLAQACLRYHPQNILLQGNLGVGKTTLTRFFVQNLQNGHLAEIASPSFTLSNIYPCSPPVHHFDLYRLTQKTPNEALVESFDDENIITIVEWPENIHKKDAPKDGIHILLINAPDEKTRNLHLTALGDLGKLFLAHFASFFPF